MKHTHILFVILAIILCVGCDYIQSPEEAAGENKNDLQYVNMDGLRRELADIRSTSFENLDIKNCAFFDVPDKMYEKTIMHPRQTGQGIVTPCVGVWIETYSEHIANVQKGHTLRGCVD